MADNISPENDTPTDSGLMFSVRHIYGYVFSARWEIVLSLFFLTLCTSVYVTLADKEYSIRGIISQTDLSDVVQPPIGANLSLAMLAGASTQDQPINDYLIMMTSPEIDGQLMRDPDFVPILFDKSYLRDADKPLQWTHVASIGFTIRKIFCGILAVDCPSTLTAVQISQRVSDRLSISPTIMPNQGVLSPISAASSYDVSFVGKNPANALRLLYFLHNATNRAIQERDIAFATKVEHSLSKRIQLVDNNDARQQMIAVLSDQERKLAVLTAAKLDYAARWVVAPTVSNWPVKPNLLLVYASTFLASILLGCAAHYLINLFRRPS